MIDELPPDFAGRLRAGAAYAGLSQDDFANKINLPGASASTMKPWYTGAKQPETIKRQALISRCCRVSGLPESFFWGNEPAVPEPSVDLSPVVDKLAEIEDQIRALQVESAARDAEVLERLGEGPPPSSQSRPGQQP